VKNIYKAKNGKKQKKKHTDFAKKRVNSAKKDMTLMFIIFFMTGLALLLNLRTVGYFVDITINIFVIAFYFLFGFLQRLFF